MVLSKSELLARFMESLRESGAFYVVDDADEHPLSVTATYGDEERALLVYIWNITHGGLGRSPDEYRIQITVVDGLRIEPNLDTLLARPRLSRRGATNSGLPARV